MKKKIIFSFLIFLFLFLTSQVIKYGFVHYNLDYYGPIISLKLVYNEGVAFSMLSFLGPYLKYIQIFIILLGTYYLFKNKKIFLDNYIAIGMLYAGGLSNLLDRFTYKAVVDFIYWHYKFNFAIFNFADVIINLSIFLILVKYYLYNNKKTT